MKKDEDEIIAEFIMEKHPEMLNSMEYTYFRLSYEIRKFVSNVAENLRAIFKGYTMEDIQKFSDAMKEDEQEDEVD